MFNSFNTTNINVTNGSKPKINRTPAKAIMYCKNKADEEYESDKDIEDDDSEEEGEESMMSMVRNLVKRKKQYCASVAQTSKATVTEECLVLAVQRILLKGASEDYLLCHPQKDGKKADFMMGTRVKDKEIYFFFVEVKRPHINSKYQLEDNYTKIMKQMKSSVDDQLCLGAKNPESLDLLVEGFNGTFFQMKLLADGVYMPIALECFSLVEEIHQLVDLPSIVEALCFVKVLIANKLISTELH
ncbi:hypothetical protein CU098_007774 [Rhizopus stolonifer]|uniref:Uncharacterized protein n=1 Tax=Rhizopus stolonifer TaxID=4846 RepID=A0A367JMC4_RHIST|nr:hypothetical protein CU098_007774 [Rhizopus stolonifer]